jgi:ribonuclease P protein component
MERVGKEVWYADCTQPTQIVNEVLQRRYRLRRSSDLQLVRQNGRSWKHTLAVLLVRQNSLGLSRFAFVSGKRVGNAVRRNRCKRLMREAVRHQLSEVEPGWDCMFIARPVMRDASYSDLETAVIDLITRANLRPPLVS